MQKQRTNWSYEELWDIAADYGESLEKQLKLLSMVGWVSQESKLPYPKSIIKHAIATLLLIEQDTDSISLLGSCYLFLDSFVSDDVYQFASEKLAVKSTSENPSDEELEKFAQSFTGLSEEDTNIWGNIRACKNAESQKLKNELKILLELIGDPNDFIKLLD